MDLLAENSRDVQIAKSLVFDWRMLKGVHLITSRVHMMRLQYEGLGYRKLISSKQTTDQATRKNRKLDTKTQMNIQIIY